MLICKNEQMNPYDFLYCLRVVDIFWFVIEVKNCVVDKPKSKQLLTNKKDKSKHGIGLKNIKDIVEKYNGQDVIEVNGNVFYHMCILYKVDEK